VYNNICKLLLRRKTKMNIDKISKDLNYILETKKTIDLIYQSKMITKKQYDNMLEELAKPYK
jgi:ABC-type dipeptide/oligopeptide/nickel transport system ATPase component